MDGTVRQLQKLVEDVRRERGKLFEKNGVTDGDRTRDHRNHNPGLYQLSYSHHNN
jgi:hypothetical protein